MSRSSIEIKLNLLKTQSVLSSGLQKNWFRFSVPAQSLQSLPFQLDLPLCAPPLITILSLIYEPNLSFFHVPTQTNIPKDQTKFYFDKITHTEHAKDFIIPRLWAQYNLFPIFFNHLYCSIFSYRRCQCD